MGWFTNDYVPWDQSKYPTYADYTQSRKDASKRKFITTAAIAGGTMAGGAALAPLWAGGAAAGGAAAAPTAAGSLAPIAGGAPWAVTPYAANVATSVAPALAATSAPAAGATTASRMSSISNNPLTSLGISSLFGWLGKRSADKAANTARLDQLKANADALALQRQQLELEASNANLDREDARKLNDAINELKKRELAGQEEQRAYERSNSEFEKQQYLAKEARAEPYRKISSGAVNRLAQMWGIGS